MSVTNNHCIVWYPSGHRPCQAAKLVMSIATGV